MNPKIIVTLGPSTYTEKMIKEIGRRGVDFVRLNMSHASLGDLKRIARVCERHFIDLILDTDGGINNLFSENDLKAVDIALEHQVKYIAVSFIKNGDDVDEAKRKTRGEMKIISKIEAKESVNDLDNIIKKSDYLLIDRGDLGVRLSPFKVPIIQKEVLAKSKKVFVATNLLESMRESPRPTAAELNDIYNTLLDGAYGLCLCGETAVGKYPLECIEVLKEMINQR